MAFRDLVLAVRTLRRSPVLTLTAAVTIALGIGATVAIFSVTNAVLLQSLPYNDPNRLVVLYGDLHARNNFGHPFSNENFIDIRDGTKNAFEDMGSVFTARQVLPQADGTPEQVRIAIVTTNFFRLMGAPIMAGRDFTDSDGMPQPPPAPGAQPAQGPPPLPAMAIISHDYWLRRYGGKPDVVDQGVTNAGPFGFQVVGVLAPGFELSFPPADNVEAKPDFWIANRLNYHNANRNGFSQRPIGRLRQGVTLARAQDEVETVVDGIRKNFPLYASMRYRARVEPMHKAMVEQVRPTILTLMGAVLFLFLIACANVANLLLVRSSLRSTELAVRSALGAESWQLVRQMLAEALVLATLGTIGGVALAWLGVRALLAVAPANLPRLGAVTIDPWVLGFAVLTGLAAALVFGLAPAWSTLRIDVMNGLRGTSRTEGLGRGGIVRTIVVVAQVALCFVLLIGSGLMIRSFLELQRINPGFDPNGVLTFQLLGGRGGPPPQRAATMRQIEDRLRALPGVQSVTASFPFPLAGDFSTIRWGTEEALTDNTKYQAVDWQRVIPGYFDALRTPLIAGRTFTEADNQSRSSVVVVDEMLAAKAFPRESAVGKRILIRIRTPEPEFVEIIGVVKHQRVTSLADPGREQVYFTDGFMNFGGARKWALRTQGDPARLTDAVRGELTRIDPQFLMTDIQPMEALVYKAQAGTRFALMLIGVFAVIAALLVGVGLYGVLSTIVRQRTAEIGLRMALGATPAVILRQVVGHGVRLSAAGMVLGLIAAFALTRLMTTMLVGVRPSDPATYVGMAAIFFVIATLSAWIPARRAATLDPTVALRGE